MDRLKALYIAKIAYADIQAVIDKWESQNSCYFGIHAHWDGCVTVDEFLFHEHELRENG